MTPQSSQADMPGKNRRPAGHDGAHHAPLDAPEMRGMRACVILAVATQDISNFNDGPV